MSTSSSVAPPKLPALRITPEGRCVIEDEPVPLDLTTNTKFSVSYAANTRTLPEWPSPDPLSPPEPPPIPLSPPISSQAQPPFFEMPQLTHTASMPLPSQLSQLEHPHKSRSSGTTPIANTADEPPSNVQELSIELADSIQMVVQTLLQVSPAQVLDITKEQFSACSLSVPTSSVSAMFTVMKNINFLSANMPSYFDSPPSAAQLSSSGNSSSSEKQQGKRPDGAEENRMEFDVGEMLQCVGDSLSGMAAYVGVDLVIYHADVSLKHVNVVGDEAGLSWAISHVIRQILNVAERGDTIELGLILTPVSGSPGEGSSPPRDTPLQCTLRMAHRYAFPERLPNDPHGPEPEQIRQTPKLDSLLLRRILRQTSGSLESGLPPPENFASGRTVELSFPLRRPRSSTSTPSESGAEQYQHDPTLRDLVEFAETLKGKKVSLYASPKACFAQHLTSYLTAWGMDVTHISPDGNIDGALASEPPTNPGGSTGGSSSSSRTTSTFIFIDDDIDVLRERLLAHRAEHNATSASQLLTKKRPPLANLHRPRSSGNVLQVISQPKSSDVIMHFTSLANYKHLKDVVQSIMAGYSAATIVLPEVIILPKPAGPRRFLTALHTAATKPSVDLPFIPIATSPLSPGLATGSFFNSFAASETQSAPPTPGSQPTSPNKTHHHRPSGSRSNSEHSIISAVQSDNASPRPPVTPSPLSLPDHAEYFATAVEKFGSTPSSGMVVQSPDGQPKGILFRPKVRATRTGSPSTVTGGNGGGNGLPVARRAQSGVRAMTGGNKWEGGTSFSAAANSLAASSSGSKLRSSGNVGSDAPSDVSSSSRAAFDRDAATALTLPPGQISAQVKGKMKAVTPASPQIKVGESTTADPPSPRAETPARRRGAPRKVSVTDKEGGGTAPPPQRKSKLGDNNVTPPISVLIVDDNPINQTILSTFMKRKKIKYDIANNGEEAVNKWRTGEFHLILMDIQMPVMDGIQATKEIRRMEKANALAGYPPLTPTSEGPGTPSDSSSNLESRAAPSPFRSSVIIVALTASSLQSDRDAALAAGCNDFLTKPVSLIWLNNKIIEWGSIKALQVWADIRPDIRKMNSGQTAQAQHVAERLQVPARKKTPSPTPRRSSSLNKEEGAAALALASPAGTLSAAVRNSLGPTFAESISTSSSRTGVSVDSAKLVVCASPESSPSGEIPPRASKRFIDLTTTDDDSPNDSRSSSDDDEAGSPSKERVDAEDGRAPTEPSTPRQPEPISDAPTVLVEEPTPIPDTPRAPPVTDTDGYAFPPSIPNPDPLPPCADTDPGAGDADAENTSARLPPDQ